MNDKLVVSRENGVKCYLIVVIYTNFTNGYYYAHGLEELDKKIKNLCADDNDNKVYDFRVFERVEIDYE